MSEQKVVPQKGYETLDDFVNRQNNFWHFFIKDSFMGILFRKEPVYARLRKRYPVFVRELTEKVTAYSDEESASAMALLNSTEARLGIPQKMPVLQHEMPYEDLYLAYHLMAELVYADDKGVRREDGSFNDKYLCR